MEERKFLRPMQTGGCACAECGSPLEYGDMAGECRDCGAIICARCIEDGVLETHVCDEEEECC